MIKKSISIFCMSIMICASMCGAGKAAAWAGYFPIPPLPLAQASSSSSSSLLNAPLVRDMAVERAARTLLVIGISSRAVMAPIAPCTFNRDDEVDAAPALVPVAPVRSLSIARRTVTASKRVRAKKATALDNEVAARFRCYEKDCNKGFDRKYLFDRHMRDHRGERPFACSKCRKRFKLNHHLKTHVISQHTNKRPFVCGVPACARTFPDQSNCRRHEKNVHGIKNAK